MMEKMIFGRYVPGNSLLHRLDPRCKLVLLTAYIGIVFIPNNAATYAILALFTLWLVILSKVPVKFLFNGLQFIFWLILITLLLHLFFTKEGDVVFQYGGFKVYERGLTLGVFVSLRFLLLVITTSLLTLTTTSIEMTDGMEYLLNPLKRFRFPVHELALMMSIALRFIPTLMDETDKIMKAQMARGADFTGPVKERIRAVVPLLIPLFINSFKRAEELATAMEARGYRGGEGRTKYRVLHWRTKDTIATLLFALLAAVLFMFRS
ncbi:MAG: energy-coupling factor transporter transmembrane protein EcfT [Caldibacillus debilis]|jgi:energy-coupling factor transport system permease protein|uniref:Energy-coupling factor transporter transmembrane protein EcfT n=1 Tax=Caldibacillus debilis TaxID=301148 RepID=A0A150M8I5_9BACI|nr:energy-coupling factor transporter transmembrane protein EcfT [Caldibacillus debilis]MBO2483116.1 energy-coupling factor transporter transmembrane protein EcfT [Bacillaceae bacterium]KYD20691.1 hypothetical protein B4135_0073 [Caldibacillus debilis]MBY6273216.1 energy-coupling factor transporter transmembrane protein EcfT [Bacillaceae bacterium]OUM90682.1 MAG: cobalt ABC transporter permease [Caldibacillus debilis]REJ19312.1 MAG: energy-coupling factor transporter transmembrane protein EcfT